MPSPADRDAPDDAPSVSGTAVRGARLGTYGYVGSQILTFLAYLALVRMISPTGFGLYAAGTVVTGVGGLFAQSGMLAALINRKDHIHEAASTAFVALTVSGALLTLGSLAISPLVGLAFHQSEVTKVTAVMSGWLFLRALTIVPDALLQRSFSFARRVIVDPLGSLVFAAVAIPAAALHAGVWALVAGTYASMLVETVAAWWFARFRPRLREASFSLWREMATFARSVLVAEALLRVSQQVDVVTLGRFQGTAALGQYRNGLRLAAQPASAFVSVMAYILQPAFAHISHARERVAAATYQTYWAAMTVVVPVSFASLPLGVPIALVFLGPQWRSAGHAIAGLCGLTVGTAAVSIASEILKATGRARVLIRVEVVGLVLILATVTTSAILWGVTAVAIAMSISSVLTGVYAVVRLSSALELDLRRIATGFIHPVLASAAMVTAMIAFDDDLTPSDPSLFIRAVLLALEVLIGAAVYAGFLAAIDRPRRREAVRLIGSRLRSSARVDKGPSDR
jgi:O-antigen/teichoic acid export membrane protein